MSKQDSEQKNEENNQQDERREGALSTVADLEASNDEAIQGGGGHSSRDVSLGKLGRLE